MALVTRKPTGKPPWPILLVAGAEKTGKSWACAVASGSDLIGRTFWVGMGEDDPDEYGAVPGARFEIVQHDGTYRGLLQAFTDAAAEPRIDGRPNLIVGDSATRLWDLLSDMAQAEANRRAVAKAKKYGKRVPDEDVQVGMDLWNTAKQRWQHVLDTLRSHEGPSILTARLELATVMDASGAPTKDKAQKIKAEKGLPFDVGAVVELPERGEAYLTGVRSVRMSERLSQGREPGRTKLPRFTIDQLWRDLGLAEDGATSPRQYGRTDAEASVVAEQQRQQDQPPPREQQRQQEPPQEQRAPQQPATADEAVTQRHQRRARLASGRRGSDTQKAKGRAWDALTETVPQWTQDERATETRRVVAEVLDIDNLADVTAEQWGQLAEMWESEADDGIRAQYAQQTNGDQQ